ncbi:hypothetical protein FHS21_005699 [Phyllobacterium trifolii]|uniref:Uncharacterized protein n=1 Tax=Phyllobacterium trifolii TaxID=300193 RepID=A0A839UFB7_9HYPH|nr:hypothetical protein [Phyllobacterium trifolii]MBB3149247.1 hypothetical protein [Phyllobacterium trifolii]
MYPNRWNDFRPSKKLWLWSMVGASAGTMLIGFLFAGWTTAGRASWMAEDAAQDARAELAAALCVEKFKSEANADSNLATLKDLSTWKRSEYVEDGGWVKLRGMKKSLPGVASLCAKELATLDRISASNGPSPTSGG